MGALGRAEAAGVACENAAARVDAEKRNVPAQQIQRGAPIVHERRLGGAPRERLESKRAGSRKEIERAAALQAAGKPALENVEQALAGPVGGRAQPRRRIAPPERGEAPSAERAAHDPHGFSNSRRSTFGSATAAGSGESPASIIRLPTM